MNAAERLRAELPETDDKPVARRAGEQPRGTGMFALANGVDTGKLLDRLHIEHDEKFAVCPGCGEPGALICENGGLKCLHDRCAHVGPSASLKGFRNPVAIAEAVRRIEPKDAAR
ncbi:MAG TPA: hypothetical protein VHU80_12240, partial [Polyangiaceae bacterium]|nr:hypothetical protein [Polyangiaceae bacterium]